MRQSIVLPFGNTISSPNDIPHAKLYLQGALLALAKGEPVEMSKTEVRNRAYAFMKPYGFTLDQVTHLLWREKREVFYDAHSRPGFVILRPSAQIAKYLHQVRRDPRDSVRAAIAAKMLQSDATDEDIF